MCNVNWIWNTSLCFHSEPHYIHCTGSCGNLVWVEVTHHHKNNNLFNKPIWNTYSINTLYTSSRSCLNTYVLCTQALVHAWTRTYFVHKLLFMLEHVRSLYTYYFVHKLLFMLEHVRTLYTYYFVHKLLFMLEHVRTLYTSSCSWLNTYVLCTLHVLQLRTTSCIRCGPDEERILNVVPREDEARNSG